jgi:hypothetical protein
MYYLCSMKQSRTKRVHIHRSTVKTETTDESLYFDMDLDYSQVYHCFNQIAPLIKSATSFQLMHWILASRINDQNGIEVSKHAFEEFNKHLQSVCSDCVITYRTFLRCIKELKNVGAINRIGKGHYYANANMFWTDSTDNRQVFLDQEYRDKNKLMLEALNSK